jgi:serine/threonine protein kinase
VLAVAGDTPTASVRPEQLTQQGATLGTAAYMSPEQIRGETLDARTDLFSFGMVLYEMAAGKPAFPGDTIAVVHEGIVRRAACPVRQSNPGVPTKLEDIISKALEKSRELRYQTAAELCADLSGLQREIHWERGAAASSVREVTLSVQRLDHEPVSTGAKDARAAAGEGHRLRRWPLWLTGTLVTILAGLAV